MRKNQYTSMLKMLQQQLAEEELNYREGLVKRKEFWQLKQIRERIKSLKDALRKMEGRSKECQ